MTLVYLMNNKPDPFGPVKTFLHDAVEKMVAPTSYDENRDFEQEAKDKQKTTG